MSDVQKAANEFFEALVKNVVDDCLNRTRDTRLAAMTPAAAQMREAIILALEQYRDAPQSRTRRAA